MKSDDTIKKLLKAKKSQYDERLRLMEVLKKL